MKDTIAKLSDAIIEEFESVREDVQKNLFQPLALRQGNLEARCQEILNDSLQSRVTLEHRFESIRALVEDDMRKEVERQRNLCSSLMTDSRIRSAKLEEDISQLSQTFGSFSLKSDVVDHLRKSVESMEDKNSDMYIYFDLNLYSERSMNDYEVRQAQLMARIDRISDDMREIDT